MVAYSGGPDSTVLLHALAHAGYECPVRAFHICHNMQPQAQQWVAHCRATCEQLGVSFGYCDVQVECRGDGAEAAARTARYDALAAALQPGEVLVLAQHADDQAETFLIQALRGAGVAGLAAMPAFAAFASGNLWRPLLALPRRVLIDYAAAHALPFVDDPSNADTALDRGFIRQYLRPVLDQRWPHASTTLSRSAHWCAEAATLVDEVAQADAAASMDEQNRLSVDELRCLSDFRQGGVLRHWLVSAGHDVPSHRHVREIQRLLQAQEHAAPVVRWRDTEVRLFDSHLYALRALPEPPGDWCNPWYPDQQLALPAGCGWLSAQYNGQTQCRLVVRFRRGGEKFVDPHSGNSRTVKKFLQEMRVPPWARARLPLVYDHQRLVAIADYWLDPELERCLGVTELHLNWSAPRCYGIAEER